jgi:hypothetical protein
MINQATWANDQQTAVYLEFTGAWQPEDFTRAQSDLTAMLSDVGHSVAVVVNIVDPRPISMNVVGEMQHLLNMQHPNRDKIVVVAPAGFRRGLEEIVRRSFGGNLPAHVRFATDLDEADRALIN